MKQVIVITGASSGFGALTARALARGGHTVYAGMRATTGRNAARVEQAKACSKEQGVDLRTVDSTCSRMRRSKRRSSRLLPTAAGSTS
jgi:NAD(P)-dependent dehydrogenase (short-subunit alcohol dehydrogenase family)